MNILIIGNGAREHVFFKLLSDSAATTNLFSINPNAAIQKLSSPIFKPFSFNLVKEIIISSAIEMVIVGPEIPLIDGVYDFIKADSEINHVSVIGPSQNGAQLEGSKKFANDFMSRNNIPTASSKTFTNETFLNGCDFIKKSNPPYVLKADGPAAGKGVVILENVEDAIAELKSMLIDSKFGESSKKVVIEEFLSGIEMSCFVIFDGKNYITLPYAKDYKRIGEGDVGLNTGGMGSISPVSFIDEGLDHKIHQKVIKPTINGIIKEKINYRGFIFIGLINVDNEPYVIEYNVRMGDPETQVVLPRIENDFLEIMLAIENQTLDKINLKINPDHFSNVVLASKGYPEKYEKGFDITGLNNVKDSIIFQAGTSLTENKTTTNGGRVLSVVSRDKTFQTALKKSYSNIEKINFEGKIFRKDIGFDL
ncbi:MAG: phosphoribosylamine--glycine ligase [Flavobacteriaceae bacterium]|nr:phosphoribosylamine--glycine ligase [Flavobacteriaceae bacterium]